MSSESLKKAVDEFFEKKNIKKLVSDKVVEVNNKREEDIKRNAEELKERERERQLEEKREEESAIFWRKIYIAVFFVVLAYALYILLNRA